MLTLLPLGFVLGLLLQAPSVPDGVLSASEKTQFEKEANVEHRIKIYGAAARRIQKELEESVAKEEFPLVPDTLKKWVALLEASSKDIESNLRAKNKSRPLISYEIQVRKAISSTQAYRIRAPMEQQDVFGASLEAAETARKKLVEILFRH